MRSSRLTLPSDILHSCIWGEENSYLCLSFLPQSLPLSLISGYLECCPFYSEIKYVCSLSLFFKAEDLKKLKTSKSFNQQRQLINHALKAFILLIRTQKIKDIKEQMPNKLIKLENNKFKDFACGILGWNDFNTLLDRNQNWKI